MANIPEIFGSKVFNDRVMRERLPEDTYKALKKTIEIGKPIDKNIADVVASAMKDWAIEQGATHYTHWFQPMTEITAEKHDSFITPKDGGNVVLEFSGKELVQGEPDASSFPSGGLRATFEARGYTAWDPTSYAFIKEETLCIPTAFYSYGGEALDKKTPLLRSMEALNVQALRILKLFGKEDVKRVITTVGPEQEYFLVEREMYEKRKDLIYTGRTLFGAKPPKSQEMDNHYFGTIKPRVLAFMKELDEELWKLGVLAKTEHNEAAPAQHELAPIYTTTNIAADHNQITMELMQKIARRHGLTCLLHEKPFAGVNGSGKHNNWSLSTDTGINLLEPGDSPMENAQFLLFLSAVIKAVDEYQELLRISVATAGNDHRLGANEAPPAIVSMFLGEELEAVLKAIVDEDEDYVHHGKEEFEVGVSVLPKISKDATDRNRTSPFAFTGNKFEFRMLGSASSISDSNVVLNTIVAEALCQFADALEKSPTVEEDLHSIIKATIEKHKRILFSGNSYSKEWEEEAKKRGLYNFKTTVDALPHYISDENVELFTKHRIFTKIEMESRLEILFDKYSSTVNVEALTMLEMIKKEIIPAVCAYIKDLTEIVVMKKGLSKKIISDVEMTILEKISNLLSSLYENTERLEKHLEKAEEFSCNAQALAEYYKGTILPDMENARCDADELESLVGEKYWPYPTYGELLFGVK
ncbi:MAG: glutamine synthetase III [Clostridia bacterium]|nr:glutamine synthetase III [Clostridia bacterium]